MATIPYRLPELLEALRKNQTILIVEGEAKVDLLLKWNMPATCCVGGAEKWKPEHSTYLRDADVVLIPDNDGTGFKHVQTVGESLFGIAKRIRVLALPICGRRTTSSTGKRLAALARRWIS